jgi:hypothetical protein
MKPTEAAERYAREREDRRVQRTRIIGELDRIANELDENDGDVADLVRCAALALRAERVLRNAQGPTLLLRRAQNTLERARHNRRR